MAKIHDFVVEVTYGKQNTKPTPILMGGKELPWVDSWPHLGNNLHGSDFVYPGKGSMSHDLLDKRGSFIGKFHSIFQEFGFSDPQVMMRLVGIYATSFYGSPLWNYSSKEAEKLFTSWNILVRTVYKVPNTTHRYLIESLTQSAHLKSILFKRYLTFIQSITDSERNSLSSLARKMAVDHGSMTCQNLAVIKQLTGCFDIIGMSPSAVVSSMKYAPTPLGEEWREAFLLELIDVRRNELELDWIDDVGLSLEQLNDLITLVATS